MDTTVVTWRNRNLDTISNIDRQRHGETKTWTDRDMEHEKDTEKERYEERKTRRDRTIWM